MLAVLIQISAQTISLRKRHVDLYSHPITEHRWNWNACHSRGRNLETHQLP